MSREGVCRGAWARRHDNLFMVSLCIYLFQCILFLLFKNKGGFRLVDAGDIDLDTSRRVKLNVEHAN